MHRFFNQYLSSEDAKSIMKEWLRFRDQKKEFHQDCECWSYQTNSKLFWNFCRTFSLILSCLTGRVMMLSVNSVLIERNWSIMNLIMNKTRNSLHLINVDKLMFIYINERALNRSKNKKASCNLQILTLMRRIYVRWRIDCYMKKIHWRSRRRQSSSNDRRVKQLWMMQVDLESTLKDTCISMSFASKNMYLWVIQ
jgi:hypothetical protein